MSINHSVYFRDMVSWEKMKGIPGEEIGLASLGDHGPRGDSQGLEYVKGSKNSYTKEICGVLFYPQNPSSGNTPSPPVGHFWKCCQPLTHLKRLWVPSVFSRLNIIPLTAFHGFEFFCVFFFTTMIIFSHVPCIYICFCLMCAWASNSRCGLTTRLDRGRHTPRF